MLVECVLLEAACKMYHPMLNVVVPVLEAYCAYLPTFTITTRCVVKCTQ
jgi:hypothetical protein